MNFGEILSKAWKVIWQNKILWLFGIFAALGQGGGGGGGGGGSSNVSSNGNMENWFNNNQLNLPPQVQQNFEQFSRTITDIPWFVWVLIGLGFLVFLLVVIFLSTVGEVGLIHGTNKADDGAPKLSFGPLFSESLRYFWRVFLFNLLTGLAMMVIVIILLIPFILLSVLTMGIGFVFLIPVICLMVPLFALINVVLKQGVVAIVVDNVGVFEGLSRGWNVFKKNFWNMVLMALILGIGAGILGFLIALPLVIVFLPLIFGAIATGVGNFEGLQSTLLVSGALCCVIYPIVLILNGILTAYVESAWTLTYKRLTTPVAPAAPLDTQAVLETV